MGPNSRDYVAKCSDWYNYMISIVQWHDNGYHAISIAFVILCTLKHPVYVLCCILLALKYWPSWSLNLHLNHFCDEITYSTLVLPILRQLAFKYKIVLYYFELLHNLMSQMTMSLFETCVLLVVIGAILPVTYFGIAQIFVSASILLLLSFGGSSNGVRRCFVNWTFTGFLALICASRAFWWFNIKWRNQILVLKATNIIERQRWWIGIGWVSELLSTDPPNWSLPNGRRVPLQFQHYMHLLSTIDGVYVVDSFDAVDLWTYSSSFKSTARRSSFPLLDSVVRERTRAAKFEIDMKIASWSNLAMVLGGMLFDK